MRAYEKTGNATIQEKFAMFDHITMIYVKSKQVKSQNLIKIFNKLANQLLQNSKNSTLTQTAYLLNLIARFNPKKAKALLFNKKKAIHYQLKSLDFQAALIFMELMNKSDFFDTFIIEQSIDQLYPKIMQMSIQQLTIMLRALASSNKYINRVFFIKCIQRLQQLTLNNKISNWNLLDLFYYLSKIESNMQVTTHVEELDHLLLTYLPEVGNNFATFTPYKIESFTNILKLSKYYNEVLLKNLIDESMTRQIKQFYDNSNESKSKFLISIPSLINILHVCAIFNYRDNKFVKYMLNVLSLYNQNQKLSGPILGKMIWSICVLCSKQEVVSLYPLFKQYFSEKHQEAHEARSLYFCYLYLKLYFPTITSHKQYLPILLQSINKNESIYQSRLQKQVQEAFINVGIPCLTEFQIDNISVDLFIPEWKQNKNIIVEVHGYTHFARNARRPTGTYFLKKKIFQTHGYIYQYISIEQWLLAENKQQFIEKFMELITKNSQKQSNSTKKLLQ